MPVKPIPDGYHTVTPFMMAKNASGLIDWLHKAFDAQQIERTDGPDGSVWHAEIRIGDSTIMLGDGNERWPAQPASFYLYVEDCDAQYRRAVDAGGESLREPTDEFYGDRSAGVKDPSGNQWWIATHIEDVPPDEMKRRQQEAIASMTK